MINIDTQKYLKILSFLISLKSFLKLLSVNFLGHNSSALAKTLVDLEDMIQFMKDLYIESV